MKMQRKDTTSMKENSQRDKAVKDKRDKQQINKRRTACISYIGVSIFLHEDMLFALNKL